MVDWATQDRLFPAGYRSVDIRYRRIDPDPSLPYTISLNTRHHCRSRVNKLRKFTYANVFSDNLHHGLNPAIYFYNSICNNRSNDRHSKLIASYELNVNWPRSICCLSETDGSIVICEQERCRLVLFTSKLVVRSTCGGIRGNGLYEFDSPWSVAALTDDSSSNIAVADTNNRRIQFFTIEYNGEFLHQYSIITKEKPYFIATNKRHCAVSYSPDIAFCLCMDPETSLLFVSNPIGPSSLIHQLTITGEYLRCIKLDCKPFLHISYLAFDTHDRQLIIADSLNSIIYSVEHDLDEDNVNIILKHSDNVNYPQALCITGEGHLMLVECSVLTKHTLKVFQYHPCKCHSRLTVSSVKTSETTSVRSMIY